MRITKHAKQRLKERNHIKSRSEMKRKSRLAIERGTFLPEGSNRPRTKCYLFEDSKYIFAQNEEVLITVFRPHKKKRPSKSRILKKLFKKEARREILEYLSITL